jgi:hypothetical protein
MWARLVALRRLAIVYTPLFLLTGLLTSGALLDTILRTRTATTIHAEAVEATTDDVITNTRKVLYTAAANENDGVFLEVVTFTRDVCSDFVTGGKTHTSDLTQCGVRLLRGLGLNDSADATALGASNERRRFALLTLRGATLAHKLINCRHVFDPLKSITFKVMPALTGDGVFRH